MPPSPTVEILCLKIEGQLEQQQTINTLYYACDKPVGQATISDQIDLCQSFFDSAGPYPKFQAAVSVNWTGVQLICYSVTQPGLATHYFTLSPTAGLVPAPRAPNHTCVTLRKTTTLRGKHGRGRLSIPAVPSAWITGTTLSNTGAHTTLANLLAAQVTGFEQIFTPGIWAVRKKTTELPAAVGWQPLRGVDVGVILGTCRRRKPGRGK
jgi:hypothetical protein